MKLAKEWLNEVGATVAASMFVGAQPPGIEVEKLIERIQADASADSLAGGLTKRECFAISAMQGILSNQYLLVNIHKLLGISDSEQGWLDSIEAVSAEAVRHADALIKQLNK